MYELNRLINSKQINNSTIPKIDQVQLIIELYNSELGNRLWIFLCYIINSKILSFIYRLLKGLSLKLLTGLSYKKCI